jgi:hypothetical protein
MHVTAKDTKKRIGQINYDRRFENDGLEGYSQVGTRDDACRSNKSHSPENRFNAFL